MLLSQQIISKYFSKRLLFKSCSTFSAVLQISALVLEIYGLEERFISRASIGISNTSILYFHKNAIHERRVRECKPKSVDPY